MTKPLTIISGPSIKPVIHAAISYAVAHRGTGCVGITFDFYGEKWEAVHSYDDVWGIIRPGGVCTMVKEG